MSWRVLILPWIEEQALFDEFKLDEPWDSPHNIKLLPRMPKTYAAPGRKAALMPPDHTVCHVFVGKGTAFEGKEGLRLAEDFPASRGDTILIVEAGKPVPWTKPEEIEYDPDGPLPDVKPIFKDIVRVGLVDESVRYIKKDLSEASWRAAITRKGPKLFGPDW